MKTLKEIYPDGDYICVNGYNAITRVKIIGNLLCTPDSKPGRENSTGLTLEWLEKFKKNRGCRVMKVTD